MRKLACLLLIVIALVAARVSAQTVQLPTFSFTSVGTTVSVPDQGAAFLGGINRASSGQNEFGVPGLPFVPFRSRGMGQDRSASNMWVTATIHDFDAMDQALLNSPSPSGVAAMSRASRGALAAFGHTEQPRAANLAGSWQPAPVALPALDLTAEQSRRVAQQQTRADDADSYFERGRQAEADGKPSVARIYYQMAARRATGDLKQQCLARLEAIGGTAKVAQGR
jgi:hypothetical protein